MPTYKIAVPDGRKVTIEAETPDKALAGAEEWAFSNPVTSGGGDGPGSLDVLRKMMLGGQSQPEQSKLSGAADAFTQGVTFGFGDELTALEAGLLGKTPQGDWFNYSKSFGDRYDDALKAERGQQDQFREQNPVTATAAELAGGLATGAGLAKGGVTLVGRAGGQPLLTRIAAGMGEGAAYGAAYGAGNADENSRLDGALSGAATGAVLGGALPVAGAGVKKYIAAPIAQRIGRARNPISAQNSAAAGRILDEAQKAGMTADDLVKGVQEGRAVGQQDILLSDLTRAVKRQPGESRKIIDDALNAGYEANNQAAKGAVAEGLNADKNFYFWLDGFKKNKGKTAGGAYDAVFKHNWGKNGPPFALDEIFKSGRIPAAALRSAQKIAQAEGRPLGKQLVASIDHATGEVTFSRLPSLEEAELIRRGLKSEVSKAFRGGDGGVGAAYKTLEQELRGILDDASPMLKKVRQTYATASQIQNAAEDGLNLLNKSADEIEFMLSGMSKPEIEATRKAVASAMKNRIEKGDLSRDVVRNLFGSERSRRVLGMLWPDQQDFRKFQKQMENSAEFSAFRQNVQGNSRTQQDLADSGALGGGWTGAAKNLMTGNLRGAAVDAIVSLSSRFINPAKGLPPQQLRRMAEILVERDPVMVQQLLARAQAGDTSAHRQLEMQIRGMLDNPNAQRMLTVGAVAATQ